MEQPNLDYLNQIADGQPDVIAQFLGIIAQEFPGEAERYFSLIEEKDSIKAAAIVHKLKHKISILGLVQGRALAIAHEEALKIEDYQHTDAFAVVLKQIDEFLKSN
ncbi:Hpt domain-containing protein [Gilvibacter sp.]|uniref:Hpt domain-containing protein n=1 Tax=Gilvibacter sp. TaxID=2729997 RepID=UPI0025BA16F9|nr:Hpt domain-containing protein [Gilvibacter sp.]NQX78001.1 Hpt domain-containing protein [Gilvibacter sp.]